MFKYYKKKIGDFMNRRRGKKQIKYVIRDVVLVLIVCLLILTGFFVIWASTIKTPDLSSFDDRLLGQSAKIYDRTGNVLLYDLSEKVRRTVTPFDQISPYVKKTTIAIEDVDFYNHGGIKVSSILRAIIANIFSLKELIYYVYIIHFYKSIVNIKISIDILS